MLSIIFPFLNFNDTDSLFNKHANKNIEDNEDLEKVKYYLQGIFDAVINFTEEDPDVEVYNDSFDWYDIGSYKIKLFFSGDLKWNNLMVELKKEETV